MTPEEKEAERARLKKLIEEMGDPVVVGRWSTRKAHAMQLADYQRRLEELEKS